MDQERFIKTANKYSRLTNVHLNKLVADVVGLNYYVQSGKVMGTPIRGIDNVIQVQTVFNPCGDIKDCFNLMLDCKIGIRFNSDLSFGSVFTSEVVIDNISKDVDILRNVVIMFLAIKEIKLLS